MSSYALTDEKLRGDAHDRAAKRLEKFRVDTIVDNEHVRLFRCWDGESGDCAFRVSEYGNCLVITGDMGGWVFVRQSCMLKWAKSACYSDSYFAEKLEAWHDRELKEFWPEAVERYIADAMRECEGTDPAEREMYVKWQSLRDEYSWLVDDDDGREFYRLLVESGLCDGADMPTVHRYAFRFHWIQRAIGWLCEQLEKQKQPQEVPA